MLKRLLLGGAAGAAVGAVAWLLCGYSDARVYSPLHAVAFVVGAAGVCALGSLIFKRTLGLAVGLAMGFLIGYAMGGTAPASESTLVGDRPPVAGRTLDGETLDAASMRGKVVLVDFWRTSCGPCKQYMPRLKAIYDELHGEGFEIVGVSADQNRADVERYLASRKLPWPQLLLTEQSDTSLRFYLQRKVPDMFLPYVFLIGRDGRIVAAGHPEEVEAKIRPLLAQEEPKSVAAAGPPAVPPVAWVLAVLGAVAAALFQRGAEAGAGRT